MTARRVLSVAIFVVSSGEAPPQVRTVLPASVDLVALLDHVGLPGAPDDPIDLTVAQQEILERAVYATLVLSLDDFERAAYAALYPTKGQGAVDPSSFEAIMAVIGLAMHLSGAEPQRASSRRIDSARADHSVTPALGALADAIVLPVWVADADFVVSWANPALCDLLDASLEDLRGSSYVHWSDPDDLERVRAIAIAAALEQRNFSVEIGIGPGPGAYTRCLMMVAPRLSVTGELIGWAGMCFDVSVDPGMAGRLGNVSAGTAVTSARLHLLIDRLPGIIWTVDRSMRFTSFLGGGSAMREVSGPDPVGTALPEFFGTSDPNYPPIRGVLAALAGTSSNYRNEFKGRTVQAVVEPLRDAADEIVGAIGLTIDITEQVEQERRDARLVRQLELAQELGRHGSWEIDLTTGEGLWSDEGFRVLGLDPGSVAPTFESFLACVHPDDQARMRLLNADGFRSGVGYTTTYRAVWPDGQVRNIRAAIEFDREPDGTVTRVYGILQDVTPDPASTDAPSPAGVRTA